MVVLVARSWAVLFLSSVLLFAGCGREIRPAPEVAYAEAKLREQGVELVEQAGVIHARIDPVRGSEVGRYRALGYFESMAVKAFSEMRDGDHSKEYLIRLDARWRLVKRLRSEMQASAPARLLAAESALAEVGLRFEGEERLVHWDEAHRRRLGTVEPALQRRALQSYIGVAELTAAGLPYLERAERALVERIALAKTTEAALVR